MERRSSTLQTSQPREFLAVVVPIRGTGRLKESDKEGEKLGENRYSLIKRSEGFEKSGMQLSAVSGRWSILSLPSSPIAGSKSFPGRTVEAASEEANSHIASESRRLVKHFYLPHSGSLHAPQEATESPVSLSASGTSDTSSSSSPRDAPQPARQPTSAFLKPPSSSHLRPCLRSSPTSPCSSPPPTLKETDLKSPKAAAQGTEDLFDVTRYSSTGLSEQEIRDRLRRHSEWIRRGENGFLSGSRRKL